ncbi:MAG: hypothetical protein WCJ30_17215 [Deltaproteobacteria bacterium]
MVTGEPFFDTTETPRRGPRFARLKRHRGHLRAVCALLALAAGSCGTHYRIIRQAEPNPFARRPAFVFQRTYVAVAVRDPEWLVAEPLIFPSLVARFRSRSPFEVFTLGEGPVPDQAFRVDTRIESISGYRAGSFTTGRTTNLFVTFSLRIAGQSGPIYDHVVIDVAGFSTLGGVIEACQALGSNMSDRIEFYLDGRMGLPRGRAHRDTLPEDATADPARVAR